MIGQHFRKTLEISSRVTICSRMTTFLGVTNSLEVTSLSGITVSLAEVICFVGSIYVKGAGTEGASIKGAGIGAACTKGTCIRDASTYAGGAYIGA